MSKEREVVKLTDSAKALEEAEFGDVELSESEMKMKENEDELQYKMRIRSLKKSKLKARFARVMERGIVNDRLDVPLPDGVYGEWVANDQVDINRMETLGFKVDSEYAIKRRLHSDGTGKSIVGDAVYMVCSRERKELFDELRQERYDAMHGSSTAKEEKDFAQSVQSRTPELPVVDESKAKAALKADLEAALGNRS